MQKMKKDLLKLQIVTRKIVEKISLNFIASVMSQALDQQFIRWQKSIWNKQWSGHKKKSKMFEMCETT